MTVVTSEQNVAYSNAASRYDALAFSRKTLAHWSSLASLFDHTLLKPEATREQVVRLCEEAATYRFACAMVNPAWVSLAVSVLAGSGIPIGAVAGFPLGASLSATKRAETETLVTLGAKEVDMVINIGALKSGDHHRVSEDIRGVVEIAHGGGALVKVILETCLLTVQEKLLASELSLQAGADFLKTSTGFATGGATPNDVAMLRGVAGTLCGVKASGGIKTLEHARAMVESGANRIGASASVAIVRELGAP
jgi:deoxyribose-phosphate aldolase